MLKSYFLAALFAMFLPQVLFAHTPFENIGDFYNGVMHPFVVPVQVLLLVSVGLLAGLSDLKYQHRHALFLMLGSLCAGLFLAGFGVRISAEMLAVLLIIMTLISAMLVVFKLTHVYVSFALICVTGVLIGLDSVLDELSGKGLLTALLGTGISAYLFFVLVAGLAQKYNVFQTGIVHRVLAGWTVAICMMILAFSVR